MLPDKLDINSPVVQSFRNDFLDKLKLFLQGKKWEAADEKTYDFMRNIAQIRDQDGFLKEDFDNFSCSDLVIIDKLWRQYSNDHYGFSVQKKIWQDTDVIEKLTKFFEHVGWGGLKEDNSFYFWYMKDTEETPFNPLKAPRGKLPWAVTYYGGNYDTRIHYLQRLITCENLKL